MINYTNCLNLYQMKWLNLFDDIKYEYIKYIIELDDETDFQIKIEDMECDEFLKCKTKFTFSLEINSLDQEYVVVKKYDGSSPMAMMIHDLRDEEEEEEKEKKKWRVVEIEFDFDEEDEEFKNEMHTEVISRIWEAADEDDIPDLISDDYGWCIKSLSTTSYEERK